MVDFGRRRDAGRGYMARSDRVGPCVLLLHEFFGLQESFEEYADRLNAEGFTVLVPDMYDGAVARNVEEAVALRDAVDADALMRKLGAAADLLVDNWHPRLGVLGFSLGADFAVALATRRPVEALVLYYGVGDLAEGGWRGPTLGHFAADDEWTPLEHVEEQFERLDAGGVDAEMLVYPGAGHWFANSAVPGSYDDAAAEAAFRSTCDFLHHHLA
jgi:carboxymethylenebutenolidase